MSEANAQALADALERRMDEQIQKAAKSQRLTLIVGGLLILFIAGYLTILHGYVADLTTPESLSVMVTEKTKAMIPEVAAEMTKQGVANAPQVVGGVLDTALEQIPPMRREAELKINEFATNTLDSIEKQLNEITEYAYKNDAGDLRKFIKDINTDPGQAEFADYLYKMFSEPVQEPSVKSNVEAMTATLHSVREHLEHLLDGQALTDEEKVELNLFVALRELSRRSQ